MRPERNATGVSTTVMLKRMKDMRDMVNAAPGMVAQAQQLGAQAQQMAAVRRTVTITGMRQIGMLNFDLLVEFDLAVLPDGMRPYPATTQQRVSQMQAGRLRPGQTLQASVDPSNPAAIWLDLENLP